MRQAPVSVHKLAYPAVSVGVDDTAVFLKNVVPQTPSLHISVHVLSRQA